MIPLVLASWLSTQTWAWDQDATATRYRVYWSQVANEWCTSNMVEFPASVCVDGECQGSIPEPPGNLTFFMVTAVNPFGESQSAHGEIRVCP